MASQNPPATVAVGGYNEARLIYSAPEFVNGETPDTERRTVHLGLDLWSKAETPIHAPLAGKVVFLYVYRKHEDGQDSSVSRATLDQFVERALALNDAGAPAPAASP
mgnify:CR=1 FL=1